MDLFTEKGFDETTVEDIAAAAGTSRRSFFRYFESKSDLMAQPIVNYGASLADAIRNCPQSYSPAEVLRHTLLTVATHSAANPRSRQVMQIGATYPAARQAQIARFAQVQDEIALAFAERFKGRAKDRTTARVFAALTHSLLGVIFQNWFESGHNNIETNIEQVLATLSEVACAPLLKKSAR